MDGFFQYFIAGAASASIFGLISVGITMMYGVARIMNVAHAMSFLLAAFLAAERTSDGWNYLPAAAFSIAVVTVLGAGLYAVLFDRVREHPFSSLVISLGLVVVADALFHARWGVEVYRIESRLSSVRTVAGASVTNGALVTIAITLILAISLGVVLQRTGSGRAMRAVSERPDTARLLGIRAGRITFGVFVGGTAVAALGGVLIGTFVPISTTSGGPFVLKAFAIAIVGGLGSPMGALLGSILFAAAEVIPVAAGHAQWSTFVQFAALVIVLVVRPQGILGIRGRTADESHASAAPIDRSARSWVTVTVAVVFLAVLPFLTSSQGMQGRLTYAIAVALVTYAVWFPLRFLGVPSLCHAAIFGAGAYTTVIMMDHVEVGFLAQLAAAGGVGGVLALGAALVTLRVRGLSTAAIITLALGGLLVALFTNLRDLTGGIAGATASQQLSIAGFQFDLSRADRAIYYSGLIILAVVLVAAFFLERSNLGKVLFALRDHRDLAESLGYRVYRIQVIAFSGSGVIAALGGVLFAYFSRYIEPGMFGETLAINTLMAVLLGGVGSRIGPLIGVALFVFLPEYLPFDSETNLVIYGCVLVLVASFAPGGLASIPSRLRRGGVPVPDVDPQPIGSPS